MNRNRFLTKLFLTLIALLGLSTSVFAETPAAAKTRADIQATLGFVPDFVQKIPEPMLPGTWDELKMLQLNPKTALRADPLPLLHRRAHRVREAQRRPRG
jgi:hypothetical protein